ncbi:MAG: hypothetical protein JF587_21125 [Catenulisporales bacterium]|nr:hypothetical protein [Catenulisporales bacterium]
MPTRRLAVVAAVLSLAGIAPTARSAVDVPTLTLSKETVKPGEWVAVSGSGFPVGARLQIEVCGVGGSSNSCAISDAAFATTDAFGGFHQNLRVTEPPTPCPCVVHAAPYAGTLTFGNLSGGPADDPGVALTLSHGGKQIARHPVTWSGGSLPVGQRRTLYELPPPGLVPRLRGRSRDRDRRCRRRRERPGR